MSEMNFLLNMDWNKPDENYGFQQANRDFNSCVYYNSYHSMIQNRMLQIILAKNIVGPIGGTMSKFKLPDIPNYNLSFDFRFDYGFHFGKGGKVGFGFLLGDGYTGGKIGNYGGSIRLMWEGAFLKPYIYYPGQSTEYGNDFGKKMPITTGTWYKVVITVNKIGFSITVNGTILVLTNVFFNAPINHLCFENFRGGADDSWRSPQDDKIYFDNVTITGTN